MHENNVGEINGKPLIHQVINRLNCTLLQHSPFIYTTANALADRYNLGRCVA